jgi:tetratricopeptide (TPR) repeat protein
MRYSAIASLALVALAGCATAPQWAAAPPADPPAAAFGKTAEADLYLGIVDGLIRQGRFEAAIAFLDQYKASQAPGARYQLLRGDALLGARRLDEAATAYAAAASSVFAAKAYGGLGRVAAARGDWTGASDNFARASALDPANATYLNNEGYARLHQDGASPAAALTDLKRAYELDPQSGTIRNNLILALQRAGEQGQVSRLLAGIDDEKKRAQVKDFTAAWTPDREGDAR